MYSTFALAALAAAGIANAAPAPQAVTSPVAPSAPAPTGCSASYNGKFQIAAVNVTTTTKRDLSARQASTCDAPGSLTLTLANTVLTDGLGRTGTIVANYQFQFDGPPQAGTIYNQGFSACSNSTLALGGSTIFYQCLSGDFYNLYDRWFAPHCNAVYLQILPCPGAGSGVGQGGDGQVTGPVGGAPVTQIGDGQVQVSTGVVKPTVTQIGDGQVQVPTGQPISQIGDGQIQAPTGQPITQIGDGQIQAPTGTPSAQPPAITQIGDGQIQAPTATSVAPPVITQIGDGQIQAPTSVVAPTTNGSASAGPPVVTQIGDGQIQAPTTNATASTTIPFTGGAVVNAGLNSGLGLVVLVLSIGTAMVL